LNLNFIHPFITILNFAICCSHFLSFYKTISYQFLRKLSKIMTEVLTNFYHAFEDATVPAQLSEMDEEFVQNHFPRLPLARSDIKFSLSGMYRALDRINVPRTESMDSMASSASNSNLMKLDTSTHSHAQGNAVVQMLTTFFFAFEDFMKNIPPVNAYDDDANSLAFPKFC